MARKIYIIGRKEDDGISMVPTQAFSSFESAKENLMDMKPYNRQIEPTELRNEFRILDADGKYLQTTVIRDIVLNED